MERLTMNNGLCQIASTEFCIEQKDCYSCPHGRKCFKTLAAYEDTGLEPEEITTEPYGCVFYCNRKCNLDGDWCAEGPGCPYEISAETTKHLLELAQVERDGRLVALPCKVGCTVYRVITPRDAAPVVTEIEIKTLGQAFDLIGRIGKKQLLVSWYLTREEAEAALKKREADNEAD